MNRTTVAAQIVRFGASVIGCSGRFQKLIRAVWPYQGRDNIVERAVGERQRGT